MLAKMNTLEQLWAANEPMLNRWIRENAATEEEKLLLETYLEGLDRGYAVALADRREVRKT